MIFADFSIMEHIFASGNKKKIPYSRKIGTKNTRQTNDVPFAA
ncbi:hypothetical protein CU031_0169 [Enterococcus faecium]|nr:hypothetical protein [Enterococcus faecium]MBK4802704.1 hypothetical protein [Enterococcus faecium]MBK4816013.1 hypothetical protein [Enterococcus faecium]